MPHTKTFAALAAVAAVAAPAAAAQAHRPADPTPAAHAAASASAQVKAKLERAGLHPKGTSVGSGSPKPLGAWAVNLGRGAQVVVYVFDSEAKANALAKQFKSLVKSKPKQVAVQIVGNNVVVGTIEEPHTLPKAAYDKVVDALR